MPSTPVQQQYRLFVLDPPPRFTAPRVPNVPILDVTPGHPRGLRRGAKHNAPRFGCLSFSPAKTTLRPPGIAHRTPPQDGALVRLQCTSWLKMVPQVLLCPCGMRLCTAFLIVPEALFALFASATLYRLDGEWASFDSVHGVFHLLRAAVSAYIATGDAHRRNPLLRMGWSILVLGYPSCSPKAWARCRTEHVCAGPPSATGCYDTCPFPSRG
jgi:hypothetical protein